jgi:hypothetical protein
MLHSSDFRPPASLSNHLHQHALRPSPVEFSLKDLLPGAEVEFAGGDGDDDFAAHDLPFEVGVGVVFAGAAMPTPVKFFMLVAGCERGGC